MGSKGSQQVQQNSQYTPNPAITQAGGTAINMATKAAQSPFQMPQAPVANFTSPQLQAFNNIQGNQNIAQPYFGQASDYINKSATPIGVSDVNNFYNPYASNVFAAQNDLFGQQMQEATGNLTQAAGGVGADRIAVGQSELARQQQLARGQTAAGLYGQALSAAQQQKANEAQAGFAMGSLGPAAQNSYTQGQMSLLGIGNQQQQQSQAELNSPYQNTLARLAFPYQNSQFLAGIAGGLAPGMGGFNSGNTTYPGASPWGTVAGLGTVGAGVYGLGNQQGWWGGGGNNSGDWVGQASGGRVSPFDAGGAVAFGDDPFKDLGGESIVPDMVLKPGSGYHAPPQAAQQQQSGSGGFGLNDAIGLATKVLPFVLAAADGGAVTPFSQGRGYDDGGNVDFPEDRFENHFIMPGNMGGPNDTRATIEAPFRTRGLSDLGGDTFPQPPAAPFTGPQFPYGKIQGRGETEVTQDPTGRPAFPLGGAPNHPTDPAGEDLPAPGFSGEVGGGSRSASPFPSQNGMPPAPDFSASTPDESTAYAKSPYAALINAGLGMLAASGQRDARGLPLSPFAAIGKGGMEGIKTLEEQRSAAQKDKQIELQAKHLADEAAKWRTINPYQAAELELSQRRLDLSAGQPVDVGMDYLGRPIKGVRQPDGTYTDPITGKKLSQSQQDIGANGGTGPEFLSALPPNVAAEVKAIGEGHAPLVGAGAQKQRMEMLVRQAYPDYDPTMYPARAAARKDEASGQTSKNLTSINMSVGHAKEAYDAVDALNNKSMPWWNSISGKMQINRGDTQYQVARARFDTAANALASELMKAFRGAGTGSLEEIQAWKRTLDAASSPEALKAGLSTGMRLLRSRINAVTENHDRVFGTNLGEEDPDHFVSKSNRAILHGLESDKSSSASSTKTINGKTYFMQDGKWYQQ